MKPEPPAQFSAFTDLQPEPFARQPRASTPELRAAIEGVLARAQTVHATREEVELAIGLVLALGSGSPASNRREGP